jgi:diadenosine tetraphosphate (Ap4A) HIT family hydrolase
VTTIFSRIIEGELPAYFVWEDERCVAFLAKPPYRPGHTLLVPREEVDQWVDLDPALATHLMSVAQLIGKALRRGFGAARVSVFIAGVEIPHAHIHLIPVEPEVYRIGFDFMDEEEFRRREGTGQSAEPAPTEYEDAASTVRRTLKELGFEPRP